MNSTRWTLRPQIWGPLMGLLAVTAGALAVLLVISRTGAEENNQIPTCVIGEPGCENRPETHQHADFALVIRGQKFDFNNDAYISHEGAEHSSTVHIHEPRLTVVHIHREHTTWDEFWRSIGFELSDPSFLGTPSNKVCMKMPDGSKLCNTETETWKFYLNGVKVDGLANLDITDLDRALFSYGSESDVQVLAQVAAVTDEACIPSEICHERIPPGGEANEPCGKSSNTCR